MSDSSPGLPPGWPTDEQRARVAQRSGALRNRRIARRATSLAVVVALLAGSAAALRARSDRSGVSVVAEATSTTASRPTTTSSAPATGPAVHSVPTPRGWRIVDFGDARLAIPPSWSVTQLADANTPCLPGYRRLSAGHFVGVGASIGAPNACSSVIVEPATQSKLPPRPLRTVHGIPIYLEQGSLVSIVYAVPELGVDLVVRDPRDAVGPILATLTSSARRVVLAAGAAPRVPADWRSVSYGGITLRVPPTMPVVNLTSTDLQPGECSTQTFSSVAKVFLGNASAIRAHCPMIPAGVVPTPADGVWISTVADFDRAKHPTTNVTIGGLALTLDPTSEHYSASDDVLTIITSMRGDARFALTIRIGLGADPTVARTILYSIRATN